MNNTEDNVKEVTNNDIVEFMRRFEKKVESNFEKTRGEIGRMNTKIGSISQTIEVLKNDVKTNEDKSMERAVRMEGRLESLETEMEKMKVNDKNKVKLSMKIKKIEKNMKLNNMEKNKVNDRERENSVEKSDLENEDVEHDPLGSSGSSYSSSWARELEREEREERVKEKANDKDDNHRDKGVNYYVPGTKAAREVFENVDDITEEETKKRKRGNKEQQEEDKAKKRKLDEKKKAKKEKERKRKEEKRKWFAEISSESSESDSNDEEWGKVNRVDKNKEKKNRLKKHKQKKEIDVYKKANHMIGIGPVTKQSIEYHMEKTNNYDDAKEHAVREFLEYYLKFSEDELDEMTIVETKIATGVDNIIYIAMDDAEHIKNIHRRKAECKNDFINIINFVPPQIFKRYKSLNKICAERRKLDNTLRTQIRFGKSDLELWTKIKGEDEPLKNVDLLVFLGDDKIEDFDHEIKWTHKPDREPRRRVSSSPTRGFLPSLRQTVPIQPGIVRYVSMSDKSKKSVTTAKNDNDAQKDMEVEEAEESI